MRRDIKNISQCIQIVFFWTAGTSAENEGLAVQIAESREDIQLLKESKEQAVRDKKAAEKRAETAEKQLKSLEERREQLQPIMDNVSKEIKEYGIVKMLLLETGKYAEQSFRRSTATCSDCTSFNYEACDYPC